MEVQKRPPSILKTSMVEPLRGDNRDPIAPTICLEDVDGRPPGPRGGSGLHPTFEKCVVTCMGSIDKSNSAHGSHFPCTLSYYVL
jgi:hypothetical protein